MASEAPYALIHSVSVNDHEAIREHAMSQQGDMKVVRKLVFVERELEKISEMVDELVDDEIVHEDDARDIRDCIINIELQVADLRELASGAQVA